MLETCLRRINTYFWDLTQRSKIIGGIGRGYQNPPFPPEESKSKIFRGYCGVQLPLEVLFGLDRMGLWPNNPVQGCEQIRGRSIKEEMKIVLQEELNGIYSGPKHIRE